MAFTPTPLPAKYKYLNEIDVLPLTIKKALEWHGLKETPGPNDNAAILRMASLTKLNGAYTADSVAWCGLFVAFIVQETGREYVRHPLWARNWAKWGTPVTADEVGLGDILVFSRGSGGHVGFYVGETKTTYCVLGGNQGDAVSIVEIAKTRCISRNRPPYNNMPKSVKKYYVTASGKVSTDEG